MPGCLETRRLLPPRPSPAVARVCRTPRLYPGDGLRALEIAPILGFGQPTRLAGPLARHLAQGVRAILLVPHVARVRFELLTAIQALTLRFSTHPAPRDRNSSRLWCGVAKQQRRKPKNTEGAEEETATIRKAARRCTTASRISTSFTSSGSHQFQVGGDRGARYLIEDTFDAPD